MYKTKVSNVTSRLKDEDIFVFNFYVSSIGLKADSVEFTYYIEWG